MGNTYTQIHIQIIFVVKYRLGLIGEEWKQDLYKYIAGIVQRQKHKIMIINGVKDHIHLLIGLRPHQSLADLVQDIKGSSSKWINEQNFIKTKFAWQEGYGAFSYSHSHLSRVINYIKNQEKQSFIEEYKSFLEVFEVEFDERYILKEPE